jgi:hypothetical protein
MVYPRPIADIDRAITLARGRQQAKRHHRDRRERDMLDALRDVERYESQMADDDETIEQLFAKRAHSKRAEPSVP